MLAIDTCVYIYPQAPGESREVAGAVPRVPRALLSVSLAVVHVEDADDRHVPEQRPDREARPE